MILIIKKDIFKELNKRKLIEQFQYNILIIDDNPFPTKRCIEVLLSKINDYLGANLDVQDIISNQFANSSYNDLLNKFKETRSKDLVFDINNTVKVILYNYDVSKSEDENQQQIIELIKNHNINIFWTDRGHLDFEVKGSNLHKLKNSNSSNSDAFFNNDNLIASLVDNIRQVAVYSFNPYINQREIEERRQYIVDKFINTNFNTKYLQKDDIFFLETSPILNLFEHKDFLDIPNEKNHFFLGTLNAYDSYGELLGNVLFDLFLQLKENNSKLSKSERRYNFFNSENRTFLRYFKLLNNKHTKNSLKIGLVSFLGEYLGTKHFLLDVPYKEYYNQYDNLLGTVDNQNSIASIFNFENDKLEGLIYYQYEKSESGTYDFQFKTNNIKIIDSTKISKYISLLHTAIFYQPDFYQLKYAFPFYIFNKTENGNLSNPNRCEIFYYFKRYKKNDIDGVLHFAVWRRGSISLDIDNEAKEIFDNYFPLIEGKVHETTFPILTSEILSQSTRAAISQVMARNMSHNIGSHVLSRLVEESVLEKLFNSDSINTELFKLYHPLCITKIEGKKLFAGFNSYQKTRMDFLADVTFGEPTMESSRLLFSEILKLFDENRLLLENISGTHNFYYKFVARNCTGCDKECCSEQKAECKDCDTCIIQSIDGKTLANDIPISMPNDILGYHAFYLILENIIRNCAKHGGANTNQNDPLKIYIDILEKAQAQDYYEINIYDSNEHKDIGKLNELVMNQNISIDKDVLENNSLRQGAWGMIEMEAAAAYLRKKPIENINNEEYNLDISNQQNIFPSETRHGSAEPNFLKAINVRDKYYGYRLFLLKPKELLVIYSDTLKQQYNDIIVNLNKDKNKKKGIKTISISDMQKYLNDKEVFAYPLLVFIGTKVDYDKEIKENETALPNRILVSFIDDDTNNIKSTRFTHILYKDEFNELRLDGNDSINHAWKTWILKQNAYLGIGIPENTFLKDKKGAFSGKYNNTKMDYFTDDNFCNKSIYNVLFEDHGGGGLKGRFENDLKYDTTGKILYIEPYNSKDKFLLSKLIKIDNNNSDITESDFIPFCKLIEACSSTIHIIDERIQELAEKIIYYPESKGVNKEEDKIHFLYTDILYATKVVIPLSEKKVGLQTKRNKENENFIDLNQSSFEGIHANIIEYIKSIIRRQDRNKLSRNHADFLLIHLGILEKLIEAYDEQHKDDKDYIKYTKSAEGVKEFIEEILLDNNKELALTKIIIISGRGKPHNMPENYLYLNFSVISQYCIENRLKYFLNEVVFSSKKIK